MTLGEIRPQCTSSHGIKFCISRQHSTACDYMYIREIHPLDPQPNRHSMLVPRVCVPLVTRWSLGRYWSCDLCSKQVAERLTGWLGIQTVILSRSDRLPRQRNLMTHAQCPLPVYCSQMYMNNVYLKGQMHHHNDLGSKCAYTCHLSNKTTRKSVLLSTPQIWLMKVSKKLAWVWA